MARWRQDAETGKLVPVGRSARKSSSPNVRSDSGTFVSPIDGSIINGNAGLREHAKRTGHTNDMDSLREQAARRNQPRVHTEKEVRARKDNIADVMERVKSSGFHRHVQYED